jgi:hypothetical protein
MDCLKDVFTNKNPENLADRRINPTFARPDKTGLTFNKQGLPYGWGSS